MKNKKGFTLIELLVVVGIIAVLAVAALIAINPLEAQRRSRDTARLQDLARLTAAIELYLNDGQDMDLVAVTATSFSAGTVRSQRPTGLHWLDADAVEANGPDFSDYVKQIPTDPNNTRGMTVLLGTGTEADPDKSTNFPSAAYGFHFENGEYVFCSYLEAERNFTTLISDGGTGSIAESSVFKTGSNVSLPCDPNGAETDPS